MFIVDDSGSMNEPVENPNHGTRWGELKSVLNIAIEVANLYSTVDVNFLNRGSVSDIKNFSQLLPYLVNEPRGRTPLSESLEKIIFKYEEFDKVLIVIATDHDKFDYKDILKSNKMIVDLRGRFHSLHNKKNIILL